MAERRKIQYENFEAMLADVDRLLEGHVTVGKWSLGMICNHLSVLMRHSVEGFPFQMPWVVRRVVGPMAYRYIDRKGTMPTGVKAPRGLQPQPGLDAGAEAEGLRQAVALFRERGPLGEHPIFGRMTPAQSERIQCIHAAHHLSFAVPVSTPEPSAEAG